ncbi:MAG: hypothetical protein Q9166_004293 [cf. Caloplaca sp. 2 TL-2023]
MGYTITSEAFLDGFCQYKLPIVRGMICSDRDRDQLSGYNGNSTTVNLSKPLDKLLQSKEKTIAYELPFYLAHYESTVRGFRVSLPESGYSATDQEYFREEFTKFIDQSKYAIMTAQKFHVHMVRTINSHISDTKYVVQRLQDDGILSPSPKAHEGVLAWIMEWLNSYHLVYLPMGIEPFQVTDISTNVRSVSIMEKHMRGMKKRLSDDIDLVLAVRNAMNTLGQTSEDIGDHIAVCKSENSRDHSLAEGKSLQWIGENVWGKSYENYQLNPRTKWLGTMGPLFSDVIKFLILAEHELTLAYLVCQDFLERLEVEGRAAKSGRDLPDWVKQQANELDDGIKDLEARMKAFQLEQLRFDEQVFRKAEAKGEKNFGYE